MKQNNKENGQAGHKKASRESNGRVYTAKQRLEHRQIRERT